jgi:competence protein ComEC
VRGWAVWQVPRNYENPGSGDRVGQLARRNIFIVGRSKSIQLLETIPGDCSNPWIKLANTIRSQVRTSLAPLKERENGQAAAILASLVIGDYTGLNTATREAFQNTGTFHVLVVSGLHVVWIAGLLLRFFKYVFLPERIRYLLTALVILAYTCVVGFQASITRCLWYSFVSCPHAFSPCRCVEYSLCCGSYSACGRTDWLFEIGFQLSFLSVMAIAWTAIPAINAFLKPLWEPMQHCGGSDRLFLQPGSWQRRGRTLRTRCELFVEEISDCHFPKTSSGLLCLCRGIASAGLAIGGMIAISLSVQLWIEPLLAYTFNRMSWIGPLANIGIVPLSSLALAAGIMSALATFIGSTALIPVAGVCASLLLSATAAIAQIPGAWQRCPTPSGLWVLTGMLLLLAWGWFGWRKFWIPSLYILVLLACLAYGSSLIPESFLSKVPLRAFQANNEPWPRGYPLALSFWMWEKETRLLSAFRIRASGFSMPRPVGLDAHEERLRLRHRRISRRYLWHMWFTKLDRVILSHTDSDHVEESRLSCKF